MLLVGNIFSASNVSAQESQRVNTTSQTAIQHQLNNEVIQPYAIPLLAAIVLRVGVSVTARISTGAVVRVTSHGASRAVERGMTSGQLNRSLSYGVKYRDSVTGARITWDSSSKATAVVNADNSISTVYFQSTPKAVWVRSSWSW